MRRVLVVEDEREIAEAVRTILEDEGLAVDTCVDGEEALQRLGQEDLPDLVLCDIMMPRLGGFELLRHIRTTPRLARLPVVLMSSLKPGPSRGAARWDEFLKKPFSLDGLLAAVHRHLPRGAAVG